MTQQIVFNLTRQPYDVLANFPQVDPDTVIYVYPEADAIYGVSRMEPDEALKQMRAQLQSLSMLDGFSLQSSVIVILRPWVIDYRSPDIGVTKTAYNALGEMFMIKAAFSDVYIHMLADSGHKNSMPFVRAFEAEGEDFRQMYNLEKAENASKQNIR